MSSIVTNKKKIFNDPIYGFITIPFEIIYDLIEHPYFQRLRRIKQLGLTDLVYPGAHHTRFHHAIGTMHLMTEAIEVLRSKGNQITEDEAVGVTIAILLHDIGHGAFSHTLESTLVQNICHEEISLLFMERLNNQFNGKLTTAIEIFRNKHPKRFLHQLVSSQLDMDRLDYLKRDSFYSGVNEGVIGTDRIIKMLNIKNDELVVEQKGIHSVEKFLIARTIMYWQVYLHKTVLSAEFLLIRILEKAKTIESDSLFASPSLRYFLTNQFTIEDFRNNEDVLHEFSKIDDYDILNSIKVWCSHENKTLADLCQALINRKLPSIRIQSQPFTEDYVNAITTKMKNQYPETDLGYFVFTDHIINRMYNPDNTAIKLLNKDGSVTDIADASEQLNLAALSKAVNKYFICYPKHLTLQNEF